MYFIKMKVSKSVVRRTQGRYVTRFIMFCALVLLCIKLGWHFPQRMTQSSAWDIGIAG